MKKKNSIESAIDAQPCKTIRAICVARTTRNKVRIDAFKRMLQDIIREDSRNCGSSLYGVETIKVRSSELSHYNRMMDMAHRRAVKSNLCFNA